MQKKIFLFLFCLTLSVQFFLFPHNTGFINHRNCVFLHHSKKIELPMRREIAQNIYKKKFKLLLKNLKFSKRKLCKITTQLCHDVELPNQRINENIKFQIGPIFVKHSKWHLFSMQQNISFEYEWDKERCETEWIYDMPLKIP